MKKQTTSLLAAMAFAASFAGASLTACDGAVEKRLDCAKICKEAKDCVGGDDFDTQDCIADCNDDADQEDADRCEQCLTAKDSCTEELACTDDCAGVLADTIFK